MRIGKLIEHLILSLIGIFSGIVSVATLAIIPIAICFIFLSVCPIYSPAAISTLFLFPEPIANIFVLLLWVLIYILYTMLAGFFISGFLGTICEILRQIYISYKFIGYKGNKKNCFSFSYVPLISLNFKGGNEQIYDKKNNIAFFCAFLMGFTFGGLYFILAINDFYPSDFFIKIFKIINIAYSIFIFLILFLIFKEVFNDIKNFIFRKGRNGR